MSESPRIAVVGLGGLFPGAASPAELWQAILARTSADGRVVDVCESTGTRGLTDDDYLRRAALLGRDDRGGGMAMFFATELAGL